jgi:transcriptional repressor NrdR
MQCINCKYPDSKVVRSDHSEDHTLIKRRRECLRCGSRFTTQENLKEKKQLLDDRFPQRNR